MRDRHLRHHQSTKILAQLYQDITNGCQGRSLDTIAFFFEKHKIIEKIFGIATKFSYLCKEE